MTQIEQLLQAIDKAKNRKRARRQLLLAIDDIQHANRMEGMEQAIIDVVQRLDAQPGRLQKAKERRGGQPLTSREAAAFLDVCRSSLSMLVNGGHVQPLNLDAPNGAPHKFDRTHLQNFLDLHTSSEISRMISDYRTRERKLPRERSGQATSATKSISQEPNDN